MKAPVISLLHIHQTQSHALYFIQLFLSFFVYLVNGYVLCEIQNGKKMVQEGALTALASVADSSQVHRFINSKSFSVLVSAF